MKCDALDVVGLLRRPTVGHDRRTDELDLKLRSFVCPSVVSVIAA